MLAVDQTICGVVSSFWTPTVVMGRLDMRDPAAATVLFAASNLLL